MKLCTVMQVQVDSSVRKAMGNEVIGNNSGDDLPENVSQLAKRITLKRGEFEAEINNLPSSVMEALYHEITGKKEKLAYFLPDAKIVDFESLSDLVIKLEQNTQKYHPTALNVSVDIAFTDGRQYKFSSWGRFSAFDFRTKSKTGQVNIKFEFMIKSTLGTYNAYSIKVKLDSIASIGEFFSEDFREFYADSRQGIQRVCEVEIEYIDSLVARDYWDIVRQWYESLDDVKHGINIKRKNLNIIADAAWLLISLSPIAPAIAALQYSRNTNDIHELINIFVIAFVFSICIVSLSRAFLGIAYRQVASIVNLGVLKLTSGDEETIKAHISRNNSKAIKAFAWFAGLVGALIINVSSSVIYDFIK